MNDRALSDMVSQMDAELARAEPDLPLHPEETRRLEILRALALGLGNFERMRAHEVHLLAARMDRTELGATAGGCVSAMDALR